ncbi:MAG TPA: hypothetical protein VKE94_05245, partial [Gemmataceae bacterium]|nr:hypothetical protein [Gemmataceae bacterium]
MRLRWIGLLGLIGMIGALLAAQTARAVIERLYPLKDVAGDSQFIFLAKVDSIDPDKPAAVLVFEENFKGKVAFRRMAINLKGDADAEKGKQTPQLVKRLAPKLPMVVFAVEQDKGYLALCYTNGTWFQIRGDKDGDAVRWRFNHFEPYLRRTFKGTTDEMKQVVADGLAGKKSMPAANAKEKPGIGPEVKADKETRRQGDKE